MGNKFHETGFDESKRMYIVCDIDDVIVFQTPKLCEMLYNEYKDDPIVNKYYTLDPLMLNPEIVLCRGEFYLNKWLVKPEYKDSIPKEIDQLPLDTLNGDRFYDDLEPNEMGKALIGMCQTTRVAKIYFVSKNDPDCPMWEGKKDFMDKYFNFGDKSELIRVPVDGKKSDYINKYIKDKEKINVVFEDQASNIFDILDNALQDNEEVVVMHPDVGYGLRKWLAEEEGAMEKLQAYDNNKREIRVYQLTDFD